jgi:hypothetical protein
MQCDDLAAAAEHMGVPLAELEQQVQQYNSAAAHGAAGSSGSSGSSGASSADAFGKRFFPTAVDPAAAVWVGRVTPVVHYTMGGLRINDKAQVRVCDAWCVCVGLRIRQAAPAALHTRPPLHPWVAVRALRRC